MFKELLLQTKLVQKLQRGKRALPIGASASMSFDLRNGIRGQCDAVMYFHCIWRYYTRLLPELEDDRCPSSGIVKVGSPGDSFVLCSVVNGNTKAMHYLIIHAEHRSTKSLASSLLGCVRYITGWGKLTEEGLFSYSRSEFVGSGDSDNTNLGHHRK